MITIPHYAGHQNDVFIPALLALLAATVCICAPIVVAPTLRKQKRLVPVSAALGILAVAALTLAAWQASSGIAAAGAQRTQTRAQVLAQYGLNLSTAEVSELIEGGKPLVALPAEAAAAGIPNPASCHDLRLIHPSTAAADSYELTIAGKHLVKATPTSDPIPLCVPPQTPATPGT